MQTLQAELRIREKEAICEELASDYDSDSDSDREDVTCHKKQPPKHGFQLESRQNELLQNFLKEITDTSEQKALSIRCNMLSLSRIGHRDPASDGAAPFTHTIHNSHGIEQR